VPFFVGRGGGLTPLGDDVLVGWLALHRAVGVSTPDVDDAVRRRKFRLDTWPYDLPRRPVRPGGSSSSGNRLPSTPSGSSMNASSSSGCSESQLKDPLFVGLELGNTLA